MARRPRDAEATRFEILNAAESLFVMQGFGSTSLAQISRAANAHKSLILHHFGSKEDLWQAVKERKFSAFVEEQKSLFGSREITLDALRQPAIAYFRLLQNDPVLVQLLTRTELEQDLACSPYDEERLAPFVRRLREGQAAGLLRNDVPAPYLLLILINSITQWFEARSMFGAWSELQQGDMDETYLESLLKVTFEGAVEREGTA
jgi:TetR/AcrR family transcriptional regulator